MSWNSTVCPKCGPYEFYGRFVPACRKCGYPELKASSAEWARSLGVYPKDPRDTYTIETEQGLSVKWIITKVVPEMLSGDEGDTMDDLVNSRIGRGFLSKGVFHAKHYAPNAEALAPFIEGFASGLPYEFQLRDDDGNVCYEGACGDLDQAGEDAAFAPLDFAQADVGATEMWYRKKGESEWKQL